MSTHMVVAIGEVLWDSLPEGLFLGGAPFNVSYHVASLGHDGIIVSRVGSDGLGKEVIARAKRFGLSVDGIQIDENLPTGRVPVVIDESGTATYDVLEPVAWDAIEFDEVASKLLRRAEVIVFGSIAQRNDTTRTTIERAWHLPALKCFDVNLRPPYASPEFVLPALEYSDIVKLNDEELRTVSEWAGNRRPTNASGDRKAIEELAATYHIATLCVTRAERGAVLLNAGDFYDHPGFRVDVVDTIGAGDAFLAGLLDVYFRGEPPERWLDWANRCGAYVASKRGAAPPIKRAEIESLR